LCQPLPLAAYRSIQPIPWKHRFPLPDSTRLFHRHWPGLANFANCRKDGEERIVAECIRAILTTKA
jgi:hypothetical protein